MRPLIPLSSGIRCAVSLRVTPSGLFVPEYLMPAEGARARSGFPLAVVSDLAASEGAGVFVINASRAQYAVPIPGGAFAGSGTAGAGPFLARSQLARRASYCALRIRKSARNS